MTFNERATIRLYESVRDKITIALNKKSFKYENENHFIRVAVLRLLRHDGIIPPDFIPEELKGGNTGGVLVVKK